MTPFARLGLLAGGIAYAVALLLVNRFLGFPAAVFAGLLAPIVAAAATLEIASGSGPASEEPLQEGASDEVAKREAGEFVMRRRDRREIDESARRAGEQ